jgi:copper homeostasis protein
MKNGILFETCVDSVDAALAAQAGGGDRIELCADLLEGGTTPSAGTVQRTLETVRIPVNVIIRPRGGDFCYSEAEFEVMRRDIELVRAWGANGVVIGILHPDGTIDVERTRVLVEAARPLSVTFHRAFDVTRDPYEALETLVSLGVDRVLTTGQESSALEGLDVIASLVQRASDRIIIMPGGIGERTAARIVADSGAREFHFAALSSVQGRMAYRNPRVFMGGELRPPEYALSVTEPASVRAVIAAALAGAHGHQ